MTRNCLLWRILLTCIFVWSSSLHSVASDFVLNEEIRKAYRLTLELRLQEAKELLDEIKASEPENLMPLYIENYIDFFTILINEDYEEFKRLDKEKKARVDKIKSGNQRSPYYRLALGEVNLFWSLARLKFNEKTRALLDANSAYRYLTENQQLFPEFIATKKSLSIIHAMAESIPGIFKFFLAIEGSIEQGTREIKEVVEYAQNNDFMFHEEAIAIYAYILYSQNNKPEEAWELINNSQRLKELDSPLCTFFFAFFAQKTGRNDKAIAHLKNRPQGTQYQDFFYLDLMLGKSLLYKLDPEAKQYFQIYIDNFKGRHYFKEAYQKMAWYEWVIKQDKQAYLSLINKCVQLGENLVDADKQALKEAKKNRIPQPELLKARLLYDGGYYLDAGQILNHHKETLSKDPVFRLEYLYRKARINHALHDLDSAIKYYQLTLKEGRNSRLYYACNSALQLGLIHESKNETTSAAEYFNQCLAIKPEDYKNSLHQKAKSGLERLEN